MAPYDTEVKRGTTSLNAASGEPRALPPARAARGSLAPAAWALLLLAATLAPPALAQNPTLPDPQEEAKPPGEVEQQVECREPVEQCFPDLVPTNPSVRATHEREPVTLCIEFVNLGTGPTATPFRVLLKVDGIAAGEKQFTKIYQRGEGERDICWSDLTLVRGRHTMTVVVDSNQEVPESSENNNARTLAFQVGGEPKVDLELTSFTITPREGGPRAAQIFAINLTNVGTNASLPTMLNLSDDAGLAIEMPVPSLAPGESRLYAHATRPDVRPVGTWIARAIVDPESNNTEAREDNNEAYLEYVVLEHPAPDYDIVDVTTHGNHTAMRGVRVDVLVANVGDRVVRGNLVRVLNETNVTLTEGMTRSLLYPNTTGLVQFLFVLPAGHHVVRFVADPYARVTERNESNNEWVLELDILPAPTERSGPNLVVERIYAMPDDPRPGEPISVGALIRNVGTNASNATVVNFTANGRLIGSTPVPALRPDQSHTAYVPWIVTNASDYLLAASADPADRVLELDEEDNLLTRDFLVTDVVLPPEEEPEPPAPPVNVTPPTPPTPVTPTPPTRPTNATPAAPLAFSDLEIDVRPVPGGAKGIVSVSLRNPNIQRVGLISVTFKVDGETLVEKLLGGLAGAAIGAVTSGEVDLPAGRHVVSAEVRLVGSTGAPIVREKAYEVEAGKKEGIPGFEPVAILVAAVVAGAIGRRRR